MALSTPISLLRPSCAVAGIVVGGLVLVEEHLSLLGRDGPYLGLGMIMVIAGLALVAGGVLDLAVRTTRRVARVYGAGGGLTARLCAGAFAIAIAVHATGVNLMLFLADTLP